MNNVKLEYGSLTEEEQKEIIKRRLICESCPFMSSNAVANPALNYKTDRFDEHCIHCKCNIKLKTADLESNCGIEAYNYDHPDTPMKLKWETFEKPKQNE